MPEAPAASVVADKMLLLQFQMLPDLAKRYSYLLPEVLLQHTNCMAQHSAGAQRNSLAVFFCFLHDLKKLPCICSLTVVSAWCVRKAL
jgi:hypothetical protein